MNNLLNIVTNQFLFDFGWYYRLAMILLHQNQPQHLLKVSLFGPGGSESEVCTGCLYMIHSTVEGLLFGGMCCCRNPTMYVLYIYICLCVCVSCVLDSSIFRQPQLLVEISSCDPFFTAYLQGQLDPGKGEFMDCRLPGSITTR